MTLEGVVTVARVRQVMLTDDQLAEGLYNVHVREAPQEGSIAGISSEPDALEARWGITFQQTHDLLDYIRVAILELPNERRISLIRHRGSPTPGTEIHVWLEDIKSKEVLNEIMEALDLELGELLWAEPS